MTISHPRTRWQAGPSSSDGEAQNAGGISSVRLLRRELGGPVRDGRSGRQASSYDPSDNTGTLNGRSLGREAEWLARFNEFVRHLAGNRRNVLLASHVELTGYSYEAALGRRGRRWAGWTYASDTNTARAESRPSVIPLSTLHGGRRRTHALCQTPSRPRCQSNPIAVRKARAISADPVLLGCTRSQLIVAG